MIATFDTSRRTIEFDLLASDEVHSRSNHGRKRHGFATLLVVVLILVLSLTVYSFANQVWLEHSATRASIRNVQARAYARGAIDELRGKLLIADRTSFKSICYGDRIESLAQAIRSQDDFVTRIARQVSRSVEFPGLESESAKLNIHSLDLSYGSETISRARLTSIPHMTPQMADSLLDWIDTDNNPRAFGAEMSSYIEQGRSSIPMNQPFRHISDLLLVRGFDEAILFGEDTNHNGWLDWNENDGDLQNPPDNRDGELNLGIAQYLSLDAFESNLTREGRPKVFLNDPDLNKLYSQLIPIVGEKAATFIVAYRIEGPQKVVDSLTPEKVRKMIDDSFESRIEAQLYTPPKTSPSRGTNIVSSSPKGKTGPSEDSSIHHPFDSRSIADLRDRPDR